MGQLHRLDLAIRIATAIISGPITLRRGQLRGLNEPRAIPDGRPRGVVVPFISAPWGVRVQLARRRVGFDAHPFEITLRPERRVELGRRIGGIGRHVEDVAVPAGRQLADRAGRRFCCGLRRVVLFNFTA